MTLSKIHLAMIYVKDIVKTLTINQDKFNILNVPSLVNVTVGACSIKSTLTKLRKLV